MKNIGKLVTVLQEDILGTDNRFMAGAWLMCLGGLVALGFYLSSESRSFLGVADSREQQISFEYPVSIKHLHVISGQNIRKGDLLVELDQSELSEKIRLIRAQLDRAESEKLLRQQLNLIVNNRSFGDLADPLAVDIEDFTEQLGELEEQKKKLYVFAQVDGIIGTVNFRQGEKVPGFTTILTLTPDSPTYVEGFVHESLKTKLVVGKTVRITPLSSDTQAMEGKIVSVGSRIIQIPLRLMSYPNMQVWGREVVVEIPPHNGLLLGEKVQIKPKFDLLSIAQATASTDIKMNTGATTTEPADMKLPLTIKKHFQFEPSGAVYLSDIKKFLIVSDDTDKGKSASLFLANADGTVEEQVLTLPNIGQVADLESISQQDGTIYLLTSQGVNKKGEDKKNRNQIIRVTRSGLHLSGAEAVDFKTSLMTALKTSKDANLRILVQGEAKGNFEIESHFVDGKDLYLGFKEPLHINNGSIVLVVKNFETVFTGKSLKAEQVRLWNTLQFEKVQGAPHRLSELIKIQGQMYAATVCNDESCGAIWRLREENNKVSTSLVKFYKEDKPEGLAFDSHRRSLFVTFDEKNERPKFAHIDLQSFATGDGKVTALK